MSSIGRHLRRPDRVGVDDDESLTDFVDEIVERVDKALEGWAGKILDEVTIMGQVRPHPRNGVTPAESSFDQDKVVQALSRRMEEMLDIHLASSFGFTVVCLPTRRTRLKRPFVLLLREVLLPPMTTRLPLQASSTVRASGTLTTCRRSSMPS